MKRLATILVLLVAACGSKAKGPTGPDHADHAVAALPNVPFDQLDHEQRAQFMKEKVVPAFEPIFKQHDAAKFAEFGCKTCHGPGADKGEFDMPNAGLPVLNFADMSKYKKEDLEWMGKEVKPAMAKLLQQPEFEPEHPDPKAFGCLGCHTQAK